MADPEEERSPPRLSTAQQVSYWLILVSLVVAVTITGGYAFATSVSFTASSMLVFAVVTIALWATVYRLFIVGIKRMVRSRIAQRRTEGA